MKTTANRLLGNRSYFFGCIALFFTGILLILINGQRASTIPLTGSHPFWLNVFFINYTFVGDGFFAITVVAIILFYLKKKQQGLALLNAVLLSAIGIQLIKNFSSFANPTLFFEQGQYLLSTDGISSINDPSAASGHTAIAFAMATVFVGMIKNKKWQVPVLLAAALVGYSRMYLAQHTLLSILIGAVIGTGFGIVALMVTSRKIRFNKFRKGKIGYTERGTMAYH